MSFADGKQKSFQSQILKKIAVADLNLKWLDFVDLYLPDLEKSVVAVA